MVYDDMLLYDIIFIMILYLYYSCWFEES